MNKVTKTYAECKKELRKTNDISDRIHNIYLWTYMGVIDEEVFRKLTRAFWKGTDGIG